MKYKLPYGLRDISIEIDDEHEPYLLEGQERPSIKNLADLLLRNLRKPINMEPLRQLANQASRVGIIVNDITRPTPTALLLPSILAELEAVDQENLIFFIATGSHRECSKTELIKILGKEVFESYRVIQNQPSARKKYTDIGVSKYGNQIQVHTELLECDLLISIGFIEPHFFAGFSGGLKNILPGMAGLNSIMANHGWQMMDNRQAAWGVTDSNPIWAEINSLKPLLPNTFLVNVTLNQQDEIDNIFCGDVDIAHRRGCDYVKAASMVELPHLFDVFITTNSGYPLDINLYQTVKGMSAAAEAIRPGGSIIIFSECSDGIPDHGCYGQILKKSKSADDLLESIKNFEHPVQDQWQAQIQAKILKKAEVFIYSDQLTDQQIRLSLLKPFDDFDMLLDGLLKSKMRKFDKPKICVSPRGPLLVPFLPS